LVTVVTDGLPNVGTVSPPCMRETVPDAETNSASAFVAVTVPAVHGMLQNVVTAIGAVGAVHGPELVLPR
jgi:hypothetical protein